MDSIDLWFRLSEVRPIAEHAVAATEHAPSLSQHLDNEPSQPSLMWVKDDGTYLMSNGSPLQLADPENPTGGARVAYALDWGQGTGPDIGVTPVGSDDFAEHLPLHETVLPGRTLIELIRSYDVQAGWLIITANPEPSKSPSPPANPPGNNGGARAWQAALREALMWISFARTPKWAVRDQPTDTAN
ncbi:DUF3085 domain-containing protein [Nocardia sp. NBC_01730]|uniref:hypothetical protein n=1 Tax=Nocardia sp. NBC_01730 TaxID=2975998 RepID=UPI002E0EC039|nr:DUF3085 domain-containing protein [Nocardia sp. NBC_01730]